MKESKKAILEILKKNPKKESKFDNLVLNLALQKVGSDSFVLFSNWFGSNRKKLCTEFCNLQ